MDELNSYSRDLKEIRTMMEKSSRFISLSGMSGVIAGCLALAGAYFASLEIVSDKYSEYGQLPYFFGNLSYYAYFIIDVALVFVLSIGSAIVLTARRAKKKGQNIWDPVAKRLILNIAIPLITGGAFCLLLLHHGFVGLVPPAMLIFYGLALIQGRNYTISDIGVLGTCQIVLGLANTFLLGYGLYFWAVGFGVLHIIYGISIYMKYERN